MNHREPPQMPAGVRRALRCLSLLLLPALTLDEGHAGPRFRNAIWPSAEPAPYLPVLGAPSLRIEEAPLPPPDLTSRPAAAAPPVAALDPTESAVAVANVDAARAAPLSSPTPTPTVETADTPHVVAPPPASVKTPPPILPDTTRPVVRPEDFLPYFQIPGTGRPASAVDVIVPGVPAAPAPAPLPPSSATYTQSR